MFCKKCGAHLKDEARFCDKCGALQKVAEKVSGVIEQKVDSEYSDDVIIIFKFEENTLEPHNGSDDPI